jgi:flagellar motor switch protein FliG
VSDKKPKSSTVSGPQRVAAFLLSLDKTLSATVLRTLDPKVVAEVAAAMTELDPTFNERAKVDELYQDIAKALNTRHGPRSTDDTQLVAILDAGLGKERAKAVLSQIHERRRHERPFAAIESQPSALVARALVQESPAVAALVLSHLEPQLSAEILSAFEPEIALDIVQRISKIIPPGFEALSTVADSLKERVALATQVPVPSDPSLRLKTIAQMLTFSEKTLEKAVLESLEAKNKEMAEEIREFMFTWNDLAGVDKRGMQKILASIETRTLAIALKACPAEVEANIMQNLSVRVRAMVADERDLAGALPMVEVNAARGEIMRSVRTLMESGEFSPSKAGEELVK